MVPKDHKHHRPLLLPEPVKEPPEPLRRVHDGTQVVVHNVGGLCGIPPVGEVLPPPDVLCAVGSVALIGDVEGKIGRSAAVPVGLVEAENLREEDLVRGFAVGIEVPEAVFYEVVIGNSQIAVDVQTVIEPLIAGVAALCGIALAPEIPGVGIGMILYLPTLL